MVSDATSVVSRYLGYSATTFSAPGGAAATSAWRNANLGTVAGPTSGSLLGTGSPQPPGSCCQGCLVVDEPPSQRVWPRREIRLCRARHHWIPLDCSIRARRRCRAGGISASTGPDKPNPSTLAGTVTARSAVPRTERWLGMLMIQAGDRPNRVSLLGDSRRRSRLVISGTSVVFPILGLWR
jgi:hypothetical protein